ncbi:MAG: hypothetical protein FOGNACKC_00775 [Anaerolineae bacterium]|nr:hypothetical protein [Anaerolineae bacterium]
MLDLLHYAVIILYFSGGKDSLAALLHLLELGVPPERIELWHHDVDGRAVPGWVPRGQLGLLEDELPGGYQWLMDWPVTPHYCDAVGATFGIPVYHVWRDGGFLREMLRDGQVTGRTFFETPFGLMWKDDPRLTRTVRRMYPQRGAINAGRWCSAKLKIDVARVALNNQPRFRGAKVLTVSGERAEESPTRARYAEFETDNRAGGRWVDRWRPVHAWQETQVWEIIERWRVNPHPCYKAGFGRCSCMFCIFGNPNQWATARAISPSLFEVNAHYEREFNHTIIKGTDITSFADRGQPYPYEPVYAAQCMADSYTGPVILEPGAWRRPLGAFGESAGPT